MKNIVIILALLFISLLHSASFDCAKASTKVEKAICTNSELSYLDEVLSASYKYNSSLFVNKEDKNVLKQDQRKWIKSRNKCTATNTLDTCLQKSYKARINKLKSYQENYKSKPREYELHEGNRESFLTIKQLGENTYLVSGESYYGINNKYGPNIGTINFISELKSNKITFMNKGYILTIKLGNNELEASENRLGNFGMNVSFNGKYIAKQQKVNSDLKRGISPIN